MNLTKGTLLSAGSVTAKDSDAAGQLKNSRDVTKENREVCNAESSANEEHKVVFCMASDTDSVESFEMQSKAEQDTHSHPSEDSNKPMDDTDSGLFAPRTSRLSSSDSYLSHQDSMKSMPWYGSSLDFDVGPYATKCSGSESQQLQLDKISESSLESKIEDLHLGHGDQRTLNRTSTPAHEVRFGPGEEGGSAVPLKPVKEEFDHDMGGRSSPESSGRGDVSLLLIFFVFNFLVIFVIIIFYVLNSIEQSGTYRSHADYITQYFNH